MEVDSSSRFRQPTQSYKNTPDQSMRTQQDVTHLPQQDNTDDYGSHSHRGSGGRLVRSIKLQFFRGKSLLPYIEQGTIRLLIDTGAFKNYIKPLPGCQSTTHSRLGQSMDTQKSTISVSFTFSKSNHFSSCSNH